MFGTPAISPGTNHYHPISNGPHRRPDEMSQVKPAPNEPTQGVGVVGHFIVIGAMKSGTTTLHRWLSQQPEIVMSSWKEPSFFSREDRWSRGIEWYEGLFRTPFESSWLGEASTSYTNPLLAPKAAERMADTRPRARLIYLLRNPVDRARSHYRHQVQRGRESRPIVEALADERTLYLPQSHYWRCLERYTQLFPPEQILVVRSEDLINDEAAWGRVLQHLRLSPRSRPEEAYNVTASKPGYTPVMTRLWRMPRVMRSAGAMPKPIRRVGARILMRYGTEYSTLLAQSNDPIPPSLTEGLWEDISRLEDWIGATEPLWERQ